METTGINRTDGEEGIVINNLSYTYVNEIRNVKTEALKNVNLFIKKGMRVMVCGKNGAGKSTLLNIIAGKKMIKENEVLIFNRPSFHDTSLSNRISFVCEWWNDEYMLHMTIKAFFHEHRNFKRYKKLLRLFELDENKYITCVSKGEKRKIQIMANIIKRKEVYVFDEITESLDLISRKLLLDFLKKECIKYNCIIIYATHIFDHMEKWCTHILYISNGRVRCFSDIKEIVNEEKGQFLIDYIFDKMFQELKENENIEDIEDSFRHLCINSFRHLYIFLFPFLRKLCILSMFNRIDVSRFRLRCLILFCDKKKITVIAKTVRVERISPVWLEYHIYYESWYLIK